MKNQALFSSKDKSKKLKCRLLQFLFGALRVRRTLYFQRQRLGGGVSIRGYSGPLPNDFIFCR